VPDGWPVAAFVDTPVRLAPDSAQHAGGVELDSLRRREQYRKGSRPADGDGAEYPRDPLFRSEIDGHHQDRREAGVVTLEEALAVVNMVAGELFAVVTRRLCSPVVLQELFGIIGGHSLPEY
jgi:hypothetical protein